MEPNTDDKKSDKNKVEHSGADLAGLGYELYVVVIGVIIPLIFLSIVFWFISVPIIIILIIIILYLIIKGSKKKKNEKSL